MIQGKTGRERIRNAIFREKLEFKIYQDNYKKYLQWFHHIKRDLLDEELDSVKYWKTVRRDKRAGKKKKKKPKRRDCGRLVVHHPI